MCGIAGELNFTGHQSGADWSLISNLMRRRGPDDQGQWRDDNCSLSFRRLSILDLSPAGHQPMLTPDENYALTFNGEIYNFRELRTELQRAGIQFRSHGDTEVVLHALAHWGEDAFERFNGMFAIAFYDKRKQTLLVGRDHAGIKPLYILRHPRGVVFASQFNQIMAHPWSKSCNVSEQALALYLHLAFIPAPYAILDNTQMIEPGSWLKFGMRGGETSGRHFDFPKYQSPELTGNHATNAVEHVLTAAVSRQLVSDVPIAAFLSGGVDSPLVVAKMIESGDGPYRAFTIGTEDAHLDEALVAKEYARQLGIEHTLERISEGDALALLTDVVQACSEPFGDYSIFPTMMVSRLAAREYKVILSGDGGDELFWGYVQRMVEAIELASVFARNPLARRAEWHLRKLSRRHRGHSHLSMNTPGEWHALKHLLLRGNHLSRMFPDMAPWPDKYNAFDYAPQQNDVDKTAQWVRWNEFTTHLTKVLLKVDRASMHESLEVRVPILDREMVKTAQRIAWQSCLDPDLKIGKIPLRNVLAKHVNNQSTAKKGFEVPMGQWLRGALRELVHDVLLSRNDLLGLPINRRYMAKLFARHERGEINAAQGLWPILSLALWENEHLRRWR